VSTQIRPARADDDDALTAIDVATWRPEVGPGPAPAPGRAFFRAGDRPEDVLVAEVDGAVAGYVKLGRPTPLASNAHVVDIRGLAVDPGAQGRGVGRALLEAAAQEAARRGARRLTLRVLGPNERARALYESCGFVVEGVLRGEFHLEGRDVDDVLMARPITV
jgi:ribosomal protein S18 acetylase RimI-like enzyme